MTKKPYFPIGLKEGNCLRCKEPFSHLNVFTKDGARETNISQMCEICFDLVTDANWEYASKHADE